MLIVRKRRGESEGRLVKRFEISVLEGGLIDEVIARLRFKSETEKKKEKQLKFKKRLEGKNVARASN